MPMLPPTTLQSNNGNGYDFVTIYSTAIDPIANADEEGNFIKTPVAGATRLAIVTPSFANGQDGNGTDLSITLMQVMLYGSSDPGVKAQDDVEWRGKTLVAQGDAVRVAGGPWAFQAVEVGPNPDTSGEPDGEVTG